MHKPRVSVVMSCYNAEECLRQAIDSILSQTFEDFEFIIVDDGSKDNTLNEIASYNDPRIKLVVNETNIGLAAALNRGINATQADYIARMDADDVAMPDRLEKQVEFLDNNPGIDILGTAKKLRADVTAPAAGSIILPENHSDIVSRVFRKTMVFHPTIMVRKRVYQEHGLYDPELRWAEDADLWYRIYDKVQWANLPDELLIYTVKQKLNWKIVSNNLKVKITNLRRRGLLLKYSPILLLDILHYSKRLLLRN